MFLSIVIPTFNRAAFLADTLREVVRQVEDVRAVHGDVVEVVVSDNASPDRTAEVAAAAAAGRPWVRTRANAENEGPWVNMHRVVEAARGRWTWFLGDDDMVFPGAVEHVFSEVARWEREVPDTTLVLLDYVNLRHEGGVIFRDARSPQLREARVYPPKGPVVAVETLAGALLFSRMVPRRDIALAGLAGAKRDDWRSWAHSGVLVEANVRGSVVVLPRTLVAQRIFEKGNANWAGSGHLTQAVEFPEVAEALLQRGVPAESLGGQLGNPHQRLAVLALEASGVAAGARQRAWDLWRSQAGGKVLHLLRSPAAKLLGWVRPRMRSAGPDAERRARMLEAGRTTFS